LFVVIFEDSAAVLGLVVAFLGILLAHRTGWAYFDGMASVMIGLILAGTAIWLVIETKIYSSAKVQRSTWFRASGRWPNRAGRFATSTRF